MWEAAWDGSSHVGINGAFTVIYRYLWRTVLLPHPTHYISSISTFYILWNTVAVAGICPETSIFVQRHWKGLVSGRSRRPKSSTRLLLVRLGRSKTWVDCAVGVW